ncbi:hypothetical protein VKT23_004680 [Stygiomarasmius scandens]|uniref:Uncharacterized protein n=1 Tax=Marasmiellus scandens TaxID=2682957 RepID=A0ABR1JUX1_9AGAR
MPRSITDHQFRKMTQQFFYQRTFADILSANVLGSEFSYLEQSDYSEKFMNGLQSGQERETWDEENLEEIKTDIKGGLACVGITVSPAEPIPLSIVRKFSILREGNNDATVAYQNLSSLLLSYPSWVYKPARKMVPSEELKKVLSSGDLTRLFKGARSINYERHILNCLYEAVLERQGYSVIDVPDSTEEGRFV